MIALLEYVLGSTMYIYTYIYIYIFPRTIRHIYTYRYINMYMYIYGGDEVEVFDMFIHTCMYIYMMITLLDYVFIDYASYI
jgi:hypothetical protein